MYSDLSIDIDGCDANGNHVSTWTDAQWEHYMEQSASEDRGKTYSSPDYAYKFKTVEDLMASDVFQKALKQSLAHKQRTIEGLQAEILRMSRMRSPLAEVTHEDVRFYEQRQRDNAWG